MAPREDVLYPAITFHLIHGLLGGDSWTFSSTSSLSRSSITFDIGLSMMLFLPAWLTLPIFNLALCTNPFLSQYVCMTLHIFQSFLMVFASCKITISLIFKFLLVFVHFFLCCSDCINSFLQWHQNSFTMCWTCLHLLQLYKLGLKKSPLGGKIIFDFMVKRYDGDRGKLLVRSLLSILLVKVWKFKILSVFAISITSDSSSSDLPCACIREDRMEWTEWIWCSKTSPIWLA